MHHTIKDIHRKKAFCKPQELETTGGKVALVSRLNTLTPLENKQKNSCFSAWIPTPSTGPRVWDPRGLSPQGGPRAGLTQLGLMASPLPDTLFVDSLYQLGQSSQTQFFLHLSYRGPFIAVIYVRIFSEIVCTFIIWLDYFVTVCISSWHPQLPKLKQYFIS